MPTTVPAPVEAKPTMIRNMYGIILATDHSGR